MNNTEQTELLIRIDERLDSTQKTVGEIKAELNMLTTEKEKVTRHDEKLKTHGKLIWLTIAGVFSIAAKLVYNFISGGSTP